MLFCTLLLVLVPILLEAQYTTGTVQGTVLDPAGAVIPQAKVTLINLGTNQSRSFETGMDGLYTFAAIPPGKYQIIVEATGFSKSTVEINAVSSQTLTHDFKIGLPSGTTTLVIEAAAALNQNDAQLTTNRNSIELLTLPTNNNPNSLVAFDPGVQPMYNPRGGSLIKLSGAQTGQISSNGGRPEYSNVELDFTDANDWEFGGFALGTTPASDFIEEYKVLTSNVTSEYGVKAAGQIQIVTKSGTNNWHGEVNEYFQNDYLNARNWNDRTGRATRTDINNYGFSMGGPLQKDRTWIYGGWHQNRTIGAGTSINTALPTASAIATVTDSGIKSLISRYLPLPTVSSANPLIGFLPVTASGPGKGYQFLLRADHRFSDAHSISARYFQSTNNTVLPFLGSLVGLPNSGSLLTALARNANITDTWNRNSTTVNQLRIGYARSVGLLPPQDSNPGPYINVVGLLNFGEYGGFPQGRIFNIYQANDVLTHLRGKHFLKLGFDARLIQDNSYNTGTGQFFTRGFFAFPSVSAFLAGQPSVYSQLFGPIQEPFRTKLFSAFFQDDYHVHPDLTANLGIRWEYQGALDVAGSQFSLLDPTIPGSIGAAGPGPLGAFRLGNPVVHANPLNIAPRVGFAWNPRQGNLVVRGGYGVYFNSFAFTPLADQGRTSPPIAYSLSLVNFTGGNSISALLAGTAPFQQQGNAQVTSKSFGSAQNFGSITTTNPYLSNPYIQQYNLFLDVRLSNSTVASIGYVGSKGTHLAAFLPVNSFVPSRLPAPATSLADQTTRIAAFQTAVAQNGTAPNPNLLRPDSRFDQVNYITDAASSNYNSLQLIVKKTLSHGLQFQGSYTWSKSLDDQSSAYPTQDYLGDGVPQNVRALSASRAPSNFDIAHRILFTGIWQLPLFQNRSDILSRLLLRGWAFESTNLWQSGVPANVFSGPVTVTPAGGSSITITDVNLDGNIAGGTAADNTLANCSAGGSGTVTPGFSSNYNFSQPLLGNNGTCGRNIVRLPGLLNFNWSLSKDVLLSESGPLGSGPWNLQLRAELYNALNNPSFTIASVNNLYVSNPTTFGAVSPLPQRKMQLVARIVW